VGPVLPPGPTVADWRSEEATNQTVFREMNEWTQEDGGATGEPDGAMDTYLCECGDAHCSTPIRLTRTEYERIRKFPNRFALALNHENPEIDSLISENERFTTIEKSFGEPARIARASNPRR
jgi:hypothetical protein